MRVFVNVSIYLLTLSGGRVPDMGVSNYVHLAEASTGQVPWSKCCLVGRRDDSARYPEFIWAIFCAKDITWYVARIACH